MIQSIANPTPCEHEPKLAKGMCSTCYHRIRMRAQRAAQKETERAIRERRRAKYATKHPGMRKQLTPTRRAEKLREKARKYQRRHSEQARKRLNVWRRLHPESRIPAEHKRKALKLGNGGSWTTKQWQTLKRQYGFRCVGCWKTESELTALGRKLVPDHIIPIIQGGLNHITNLQPLCHGRSACNNRKGGKYQDFVIS